MKRFFSVLLVLCLALSLFACAKEEKNAETGEVFSPLLRFKISDGKADQTRVFYLPKSDGFLYVHPNEEGGITGGFVSPKRSISSESVFKSDASSAILVWEDASDRAHLLTDKELFTLLLKENGAHRTALPETFTPQNPVSFNTLSFINEKDDLLLIHPIDFKETYVLAQSARLPDFGEVLLAGDSGKKIWYTRKDKDAYKGIGFFDYGANFPLGNEDFPFDAFQCVGKSAVLFTRYLEDGVLYLYRNLDTGETRSMISDTAFEGVICDPAGKILCGSVSSSQGGAIHILDLEKGIKKGEYAIDYGTPSPSLAISSDAQELLIAVGKGSDEILGTLNLSKY